MSKKKELLAIGATAASCAAAAAGYSFFKNENKPDHDQPNKKLIESAKDTIVEKEVRTASAAFEYDEEEGDIIGGEKASIYRGPSDNANIQQTGRDKAGIAGEDMMVAGLVQDASAALDMDYSCTDLRDDATIQQTGGLRDEATIKQTGGFRDDATIQQTGGFRDEATIKQTGGFRDDATIQQTGGWRDEATIQQKDEVMPDQRGGGGKPPCVIQ